MAAARESQPVSLTNSTASLGVGQERAALVDLHVLFHAAQPAQFGLHADAFGVRPLDHPLGDVHVPLKGLMAGVDHH